MRIIKPYAFYILLGLLYPIVKLIYYINGLVYLRGVVYGLIAGVSTIRVGILALKEYDGADKQKMPRIGFAIMKTVLTLRNIFKIKRKESLTSKRFSQHGKQDCQMRV